MQVVARLEDGASGFSGIAVKDTNTGTTFIAFGGFDFRNNEADKNAAKRLGGELLLYQSPEVMTRMPKLVLLRR
jgi:hypothetical protein